jgi:hypothetical protein
LTVLQVNSRSIDQKSGEIWTGQVDLQPISFKSGRLLAVCLEQTAKLSRCRGKPMKMP